MRGLAKMTIKDFEPSYFWSMLSLAQLLVEIQGERPRCSGICVSISIEWIRNVPFKWGNCAWGQYHTKRLHIYILFFIVGLAETCAASGSDFTVTQRLSSTFPELPAFHPEPAQVPFPEDLHGVSDRKLPNHDILWCSELPGGITAFSSGLLPARWTIQNLSFHVHYWTSFLSCLCRIQDSLVGGRWPQRTKSRS